MNRETNSGMSEINNNCAYPSSNMANALANAACERCKSGFAPAEKIVNSNGELYHEQCFVCAQCFQQFPEGLFYEVQHGSYN